MRVGAGDVTTPYICSSACSWATQQGICNTERRISQCHRRTKQQVLGRGGEGISQEGVGKLLHLRQSCIDTRVVGRVDVAPAGQPSDANTLSTWTPTTHRLQMAIRLVAVRARFTAKPGAPRWVLSHCVAWSHERDTCRCCLMSPAPLLPKAREEHARLFPGGHDGAVVER
jgi:hypothetical protein